jgi:hypothetical protein
MDHLPCPTAARGEKDKYDSLPSSLYTQIHERTFPVILPIWRASSERDSA